jgi:YVTN family beta-propeller protein
MEFRILGPVEVSDGGRQVPLGGSKQRAVLALLLVHRGETVSVDRLVDELWGERPPDTATKTVQVYVSRLRKALGDGVLITRNGGYALELDADDVDADRFEGLARDGQDALERGDAEAAAEALRGALGLWHGPPLADLAYEDFAQQEIGRLEEERLGVLEDRIEADLGLGRHAALVPELEALVSEHPTRERPRAQLMLALYRSGRQADALEVYRDGQRTLDRELGLEPGPELQELERAILDQDPAIAAPPRGGPRTSVRRRRGGVLVAFGGGLLIAAALAAILASGNEGAELAEPNSLAVIDPASNQLVDTVPTGIDPADVSADAEHVWIANRGDDTVTEVDPATKAVVSTNSAPASVGGMAAGADGVWIGDSPGESLVRLDPEFPQTARSIELGRTRGYFVDVNPVAVGQGAVWLLAANGEIARVNPKSHRVADKIPIGNSPAAIATGAGSVWVADSIDDTVTRIDPAGANAVATPIPVGQGPSAIAVGEGAVWVANTQDDTVSRIDPRSAAVTRTISVGARPTGIAASDGAVWVANSLGGTVSRIDPRANRVAATIEVGEAPQGVTVAHGQVWVTIQASAEGPDALALAGGEDTARVVLPDPDGFYGSEYFAITYATCALLYNAPDRPFPEGSQLQPEMAAGQPLVSDDGMTYRFLIRPGFRFSPPSNEPVTAAAFERALERALAPKTPSFAGLPIVGADEYTAGRTRTLKGVEARNGNLVIRLTRPLPDLPTRLSANTFCAVPPNTPLKEPAESVPSAGPYYIAWYDPEQGLVLRRNPNYGGERPQRLEEIRIEFGVPLEHGLEEVEAGRADYVPLRPGEGTLPVSARVLERLNASYGPDSEAAQAGHQRLFTQDRPAIDAFVFNTQSGPFANPRLRRAVNYAIDRPQLSKDTAFGHVGRPTDQFIPPGIPGFEDAAIYPLDGPDLAVARRLAGEGREHAVLYTCDRPGCIRNAQILESNLGAIGIDLEVRRFATEPYFRTIAERPPAWDIAFFGWVLDYADPYDFTNALYGPDAVGEASNFRDPRIWRRMTAAARLTGEERLRAYARLDRDLARAAPAAPYASNIATHFLSDRMGCAVLQPLYGLDLAALCVRGQGGED